ELGDLFRRARTLLQAVFADYQLYPGASEPLSFVGHPVLDESGLAIGVIVLQIGNKKVYDILGDYTGLGSTGETLVGTLHGDEILFAPPLRFDPQAPHRRRVKMGGPVAVPLQRGVKGQRGFGITTDYRGRQVAAVWSYVPSARWGLVIKQDTEEAYAMINQQRIAVAGLLLGNL